MKHFLLLCLIVLLMQCQQQPDTKPSEASERPNILWLVTEDMGPYIPAFGDSTIQTPNLSRLASEGVRFTNLYSPSGVCAPSRAAIATGMYPSGIGANHMRTHSYTDVTGLVPYEAVPPSNVRMMSELLRANGYYCTNNVKKDYQFRDPVTAWDESSNYAHWRNRKEGQPFFSIFNFTVTHESGLFEPYGMRINEFRHYQAGDTSFQEKGWNARLSEEETPIHIRQDLNFPIPPYLPDTEIVRRDMWKMYNNIAEMDRQVGAILDQLEADGLLETTIIFFYADHGGPLPRQKRLIYDSGLNSPMIIRFPNQKDAATIDEQLVSFIDLAPTVLTMTGTELPDYLQGQTLTDSDERTYIHAAADRFDGFTDVIRAVRDGRYKYVRNYRPEQPYYLPVTYRERIPTMQELLRLRKAGSLTDAQALWFRSVKPKIELFDCLNDPHELNNIAQNPDYAEKVIELSKEMDRWLEQIGDQPNLPEAELITKLWDGATEKPITLNPNVKSTDFALELSCETPGASIGYQIVRHGKNEPNSWEIYQAPFKVMDTDKVKIQAHRIGYEPSEIVVYEGL